ncbi:MULTISPECIES: HTH-type transcriptional repressor PurR [Salinivibrio]|uniref:HTH-type transcriptional repressor PurR n=1 Tax=Salinivibrio TaxID=51366 RepID=UPI0009897A46|nr:MULTISPECIES: HTH-type transcriptional repressor PurR [Salinivibrio]OOF09417.1 transcriptional repressor PurR [Salinivibrio sp. PR5]OOF18047.1 transcriptional repressor PurR [Salinivibrio sp. PR932]OOF30178.1 transcriptional repressor PurR [Salinivibrio proteolyticus]
MATIKDVARLAGVSTTTVSHVINKTRFVAEKTTEKVWQAVEELNYAPSAVARSLKCNTTRTLGMLVTKSTNPFFAELVHGVEDYCYKQGYTLILCNTEGNLEKQRDYLRMLSEKRVDGLIVVCSDLNEDLMLLLEKKRDLPMVVMDWGSHHIDTDRIEDNAELGGYLATKHFIDNGHTRIGCISGQMDKNTCKHRLNGYFRALKEANIPVNENWLIEADFEADQAQIAAKQLATMSDRPTAVFCFNDIMALAAISTFNEHGLKVPDDISVIGYDNIDLTEYFSPPLTTIHQPKRRLGKTAVKLLLARIANNETQQQVFEMQPALVSRQSVKTLS